jgi:hypothetical protein
MDDAFSGSRWLRWDPHLHTPDTALNNQFHDDDWDIYFTAIDRSDPPVSVLGITDYWSIRSYVQFLERRADRLPKVRLVFPNIEIRLAPQTAKGNPINLHILVSPDDPDHVERITIALSRLTISLQKRTVSCDYKGLTEFGRLFRNDPHLEENAAYRAGVEQFKVDASAFFDWYRNDAWLQQHSLLAVSGGNDGLAGVRKDSGFRAYHDELVRNTELVFSSQTTDRDYFLGLGPDSPDEVLRRFDGLRPCVWGCDAHHLDDVLQPYANRYCWIKAAPTFDGLRQVTYEPAERVCIGEAAPEYPDPDSVLTQLSINSPEGWFETTTIPFAAGLTAIIGEKGSGKTALLDLIAAASSAWKEDAPNSFLRKAKPALPETTIAVTRGSGRASASRLSDALLPDPFTGGEVRYLSQHFVEQLCADDMIGQALQDEIERVIFDHIPASERLNAAGFAELRELLIEAVSADRGRVQQEILELNFAIAGYAESIQKEPALRKELNDKNDEVKRLTGERLKVAPEKDKASAEAIMDLRKRVSETEARVATVRERLRRLEGLRSRIARLRQDFDTTFADLRSELQEIGVHEKEWGHFRVEFHGEVDPVLAAVRTELENQAASIEGTPSDDAPKETIHSQRKKLQKMEDDLKLDTQRKNRLVALQKAIDSAANDAIRITSELTRIQQIRDQRLPSARQRRLESYLTYFDLLAVEQRILAELYTPLEQQLPDEHLRFRVIPRIDVKGWADRGEAMLDLRKSGKFSDRGSLESFARATLEPAWRNAEGEKIRDGLQQILTDLQTDGIAGKLRSGYQPKDVADWLYSVDHLSLEYTLTYRGTDIRLLSPGARGIVLLLLYLAADRNDVRPLLIDQPEENLDNASVYEVLVRYFREAKARRQIIIVTHNPNLVVNTDAEQVVVASAVRMPSGFPRFRYEFGPLEAIGRAPAIRDQVCQILEGGRDAFSKRERRYRIR